MRTEPGTPALFPALPDSGLPGNVLMAGAVEAVTAHPVHSVEFIRQGVTVGMGWHALVKGGVKNRHMGRLGKNRTGGANADQVGRVMQRRKRGVGLDRGHYLGINQGRTGELLAAVHHPVTYRGQRLVGVLVEQGQQGAHRGGVTAFGQWLALPASALLPMQYCPGGFQLFGQTAEQGLAVTFTAQGKLDGRATAIDDKYQTLGHGLSNSRHKGLMTIFDCCHASVKPCVFCPTCVHWPILSD